MTNQLLTIDPELMEAPSSIKLCHQEVDGPEGKEVIVLKDPFNYQHCTDTDMERRIIQKQGKFIVEVFWRLARKQDENYCNLKLVDFKNHFGGGFTLGERGRMAGGTRCTSIPVAVPCRPIAEGDELVLHYAPKGRRLESKAKVSNQPQPIRGAVKQEPRA